ncbi:response regulator [Clostridium oceanicum]|uniref:Transcriptional regulatory protein n=1 Tax=Clostridium oceanicum TaxID=1543 RepID=A0ABP3UJI0_9CLOT
MIKVVIIEDDPMVREINEGFLRKVEGYLLLKSVSSIEEGKEVIKEEKPDLVLLDLFFPKGLGTELLKWIRINNIKCDVILITADKSMETVEESFRYGVVDYIIKPFTFNRFKEALLQYMDRRCNFENCENIEQELIDKMVLRDKEKNVRCDYIDNIKGVSTHTYDKILQLIKERKEGTITAQELALITGVSRITARRYLDLLEKQGELVLIMEYGKVGRPLNKYRIKEKNTF